jgi:hypothetical protein
MQTRRLLRMEFPEFALGLCSHRNELGGPYLPWAALRTKTRGRTNYDKLLLMNSKRRSRPC